MQNIKSPEKPENRKFGVNDQNNEPPRDIEQGFNPFTLFDFLK